jgi:hypothetical protein
VKANIVRLDEQQFQAIVQRLDKVAKLLAAEREEDPGACPRCREESETPGQLCAKCKVVVEEVPA